MPREKGFDPIPRGWYLLTPGSDQETADWEALAQNLHGGNHHSRTRLSHGENENVVEPGKGQREAVYCQAFVGDGNMRVNRARWFNGAERLFQREEAEFSPFPISGGTTVPNDQRSMFECRELA